MQNWADPTSSADWREWARLFIRNLQQAFAGSAIEVGAIQEFVVVPPGWALANGTVFDAISFPILAGKLGGSTLPNLATAYPASGLKVCIKLG